MPMSYPKRPPPAAAGREIAHGPHRHHSGIATPGGEELLVWSASGSAAAGGQNKRHGAGTRRGSARGGSAAFRSCCMGKRCIAGAQRGQRLVPTCRGNQRHNHHIPAAAAGQAQHSTAQHSTARHSVEGQGSTASRAEHSPEVRSGSALPTTHSLPHSLAHQVSRPSYSAMLSACRHDAGQGAWQIAGLGRRA
jgi:hypothetical protein